MVCSRRSKFLGGMSSPWVEQCPAEANRNVIPAVSPSRSLRVWGVGMLGRLDLAPNLLVFPPGSALQAPSSIMVFHQFSLSPTTHVNAYRLALPILPLKTWEISMLSFGRQWVPVVLKGEWMNTFLACASRFYVASATKIRARVPCCHTAETLPLLFTEAFGAGGCARSERRETSIAGWRTVSFRPDLIFSSQRRVAPIQVNSGSKDHPQPA
jgi:hypothetical protein